jgi:uncharacterized protein (TIGR02246 family)
MRRSHLRAILVSSLVLIGLIVACKQAPPPSPPDTRAADERAIREADAAWSKAAAARDVEGTLSFHADDGSELPPNRPIVTGKEALRAYWLHALSAPGITISWRATNVEVARSGDLGYAVGIAEVSTKDTKGKPVTGRGKYMTVWKKQPDGKWKAVADIFNSDLPAAEAAKH